MKVENLPRIVRVNRERKCYECGGVIKKKTNAVFYWWVKKSDAYSHIKCTSNIKK